MVGHTPMSASFRGRLALRTLTSEKLIKDTASKDLFAMVIVVHRTESATSTNITNQFAAAVSPVLMTTNRSVVAMETPIPTYAG